MTLQRTRCIRSFGSTSADVNSLPPARLAYVTLALCTIAVGLLVHLRGSVLGVVMQDVLGDALWAAMILWWISAVAPERTRPTRSAIALLVCVAVELSQLSQAPLLDAVRATRLGALVLGSGFDLRDLGAYTLGIIVATFLDARLTRRALEVRHPVA